MKSIIFLSVLCLGLSSCTVLQWRMSNTEIQEHFADKSAVPKISYFNVDSLNLNVRVQHIETNAKPNAVNLLFLHGSPSSSSAWNKYLEDSLLLKKANIHAVDRPGYGYSNFGDKLTSIKTQALVMSALIDHYNLKNVITIGSSYGGPLAARIAVENPNVKGVIMISPAIDPEQEKDIWASRFTQWWLTRWLVPTGYRVAGDEKTVHAKELALIAPDWHKVNVPVIHIHGNADDLVPYTNTNYSKLKFSAIEIVTTPNTGHEIAWSRPELITPHIFKLIENVFNTTK